jgi:hypothetical protein
MRVRTLLAIVAFCAALLTYPASAGVQTKAADGVSGDAVSLKTLDSPPSGLTPATARLAYILAAHDKAVGTLPERDTVSESWAFVDSGLAGTEELQRDGTNYHSRIARGPFVEQYGQFEGKRWHQDANGFTSPSTAVDDASFQAVRVLEDAADPKNDVSLAGITKAVHPAYVVSVKRPGSQHPEWIFYDRDSAQIVRIESISHNERRLVQTFDDFRTNGGVTGAWHVHDTDGRPELDDDWHLTSIARGAAMAPSVFAQPATSPAGNVTTRAAIPSVFLDDGTIIVRVVIGGRGLDFEIDTAESDSVIDESVADELKLPTYGQTTRLSSGANVGYWTTIPEAQVGPATLKDFHVRAKRFTYAARHDTRVVGLLGYDFLANHVVHVDYVHHQIELLPVADFAADKPVDGGLEIPLAFDDGLPLVPMAFGDAIAEHAIIGSSMPFTIAMGSFYSAHQDQFEAMGKHQQSSVPFADSNTVGRDVEFWLARTSALRFANANFANHPFLGTALNYDGSQEIDAILGADFLSYYDLYYDFPRGRFFVKPNEWFFKTFVKTP